MKAPLRFVWSLLLLVPLGGTAWGVSVLPGENLFSSAPFDDVAAWVRFDPQPEPPGISFHLDDPGTPWTYRFQPIFSTRELNLLIYSDAPAGAAGPLVHTARFVFDRDLLTGPGATSPGMVWLNAQPRWQNGIAFEIDLFFDPNQASGIEPVPWVPPTVNFTLYNTIGDVVALHPVPEPGTLLLLGSGLAGLAGWARRGRRA